MKPEHEPRVTGHTVLVQVGADREKGGDELRRRQEPRVVGGEAGLRLCRTWFDIQNLDCDLLFLAFNLVPVLRVQQI